MDKLLIEIVQNFVKPLGFKKKNSSWYRSKDEVWQIISLQRHFSSNFYHIYFSVFVKQIDPTKEFPSERFAHIRTGVFGVLGHEGNEFREKYLDLDIALPNDERSQAISNLIGRAISEYFEICDTLQKIKESHNRKSFSGHIAITGNLVELLN